MSWTARFRPGARVTLCGDHPWAGYSGEVLRSEFVKFLQKRSVVVRLDNGQEVGVVRPERIDFAGQGSAP